MEIVPHNNVGPTELPRAADVMLSRAAAVMGNIAFALEIHPSNKKYWTNLRKYAIDTHWKNNNQVGPVYAFKVHRDHGAVGRFQDNSFIYLLYTNI